MNNKRNLDRMSQKYCNVLSRIYQKCIRAYGKRHLKWYANYLYKKRFGRNIDWINPTEFNEKIYWMSFYTDTSLWSLLADKYRVKEYLIQKGYSNIVPKLYGHWESVEDVDFDNLPDKFVIKTNHGFSGVFVVEDKTSANIEYIKKGLEESISNKFGYATAEIHYLRINPCIIAEELLPNESSFSNSIVDYKFYCFNGEPEICAVFYNRNVSTHKRSGAIYDMNWIRHDEWLNPEKQYVTKDLPTPKHFDYMKQLCSELGKGIPFVRIDFYEAHDKVYLGEFTFTPASLSGGSLNPNLFMKYGEKIDLSLCKVVTSNLDINNPL